MPTGGVSRQKDHAHAIVAGRRQRYSNSVAFRRQEFVRYLQEYARPIPGVAFAATSAAMLKIQKNLDCLLHDVVSLTALQVNDETHTTSIVLVRGIVQTLFCRSAYHPWHSDEVTKRGVPRSMAAPPDRSGAKPEQKPTVIQKAINLWIDGLIENFESKQAIMYGASSS